ncbi:2-hydroxyacid dehydrogenase [Sporomusa acidovorans]|uniref:Glyoxylate/hydroxypyruvate reductase B n=1 Tax=Sporomusa acidovorans (strain ATCC 49682 / DSM 3132 / Mol) TaxID=1123286 RepID=A0ABZ3J3X1_SPOA4|nr:D-glycerate dehydrogenase [Sporomusa acidovorans]OZC15489.1 glyoxylate/hydroxypyruvate reductase B [Sporomusa acidovorans DSM 3132]SDE16019.1 glyoxylate reductase [Sporomusa acidovorans]
MNKHKVVITGQVLPSALAAIKQQCEIYQWQETTPPQLADLIPWLQQAEGLFVTGNIKVNDTLLAAAPGLKVIVQPAVGYDNIDIKACTSRQIPFGNTPGVLNETTADLAFGLLMTAARRIHESWAWVRDGKWRPGVHFPLGIDLYNKTLGIVGMGAIGAAVAKRAQVSGMKVIYYNRRPRTDQEQLKVEYRTFSELLAEADFIIVLTPLTPESRGLFGAEEFAQMKPTAYLINAARGPVVDSQALYTALVNNEIAYAALDVTDPEPLPADHPLLTLPNILVVPHIGSATIETRNKMAMLAANNLLLGLAGKSLVTCVNTEVNYR